MKQAKTLKHKITNHSRIFDETVDIYNQALSFIIDVIDAEFGDISMFSTKRYGNDGGKAYSYNQVKSST